jgi:medium-chain acyl-[acyl-carrier-protein] hydrolase
MNSSKDWLVNLTPQRTGRLNLLCLPFAGGGSSAYHSWPAALPPDVAVWAARLPGRESRLLEPPLAYLEEMVRELVQAVKPLATIPYVLFGHSMGALIGYEMVRRIRYMGGPMPESLIVSGCGAPHLPSPSKPLHTLPHNELVAALRDYGATPQALLDNRELLDLFLPTLRADFKAAETYRHRPGMPLSCPITVLRGDSDIEVTAEHCDGWAELTSGPCDQHCYVGGHFFIDTARDQVLGTIAGLLAGCAA